MRKFLLKTLERLQLLTGLKQFENLKKAGDKESIKLWLDSLESVCNRFGNISDEIKQRIITQNLIKDQDYTGLNARTLQKWFDYYWNTTGKQKHYYEQQKMVECDNPLPPEESQKYIDQMRDNWDQMTARAEDTKRSRKAKKPDWYNDEYRKAEQSYLKERSLKNDKEK